MALIDARDRFAARREEARHADGQFGEQAHSAPELTLVADPEPQTLADILDEMNELGELDDDGVQAILDAPIVDTYTGTPFQAATLARNAELNSLLSRAGIDRDDLSEKTLGQIQEGLNQEFMRREVVADYHVRQLPPEPLPEPRTPAERDVRGAVTAIIEARGYTLAEYDPDSRAYMERWAREQQAAGGLATAAAAEVARSIKDRAESDGLERQNQIATLGELTDAVWDDAHTEDRLRAQQLIRRFRPTNYVSLKDTNAAIRGAFKDEFPGAKFSVRGNSYSGGASTDISWVDGPPEEQVKAVSDGFAGANFDGMVDLKSYHSVAGFDADGIPVSTHYAADFVFTRRDFSEEVEHEAKAFLIQAFAAEGVTFDPNERNTPRDIPQALFSRATEENGGQRAGGYGFTFRGNEHYGNELIHIASTLIANERWNARKK